MPLIPMQGPPGPGGPPDGGGAPEGPVTMYTQAAIQALHDAIAHEPDPENKQIIATCLQQLLKVQAKEAAAQQQSQGGPQQALAGRLGG